MKEIELKNYSKIQSKIFTTMDDAILLVKFKGDYRTGSEGNPDGLYMLSVIASNYFALEPILLIIDVQELNYIWGNTVLRSLNFFNEIGRDESEQERKVIVVVSKQNESSITEVLKMSSKGNRTICTDINEAINIGEQSVKNFLEKNKF